MRKLLLLLMIVPMIGLGQNTLLVPSQYSTIQNAINASSNNDTVLVSPDTYYENINFNGKNIFLTSYYHTTLDTSFISSTIIDGQNSGNVVRIESNEDTTCVLNGFTITNGNQSGSGAGGGIYISNSDPSLSNLIIENNQGEDGGGIGIYSITSAKFSNLLIRNNISLDDGGGIWCHGPSSFELTNSFIHANTASDDGGGIWCNSGSIIEIDSSQITNNSANWSSGGHGGGISIWGGANVTVKHTVLRDNSANTGGGIYSFNSSLSAIYCEITNNSANNDGGGITISTTSVCNADFLNLTFADNSVASSGSPGEAFIFSQNGGSINNSIKNCIIWGTVSNNVSLNITYCDELGGGAYTGSFDSDPLFVDPTNSNYRLQCISPCINTGDPNSIYNGPDGTRNDMGAYPYEPISVVSNHVACDSILWNGNWYDTSGTYTNTTISSTCDTIETLNLTINPSTTSTSTATACDTYTWNGTTYTTSGTYTDVSTNASGCTHTETLYLTINNSTSNSTTLSLCDSYTWAVNGTTYTQSGTYTDVSTNASGCTHTETLYLTINNSTTSTATDTSCGEYTWNGNNYTISGTYSYLTINSNGCDSTAILNLTIIPTITYTMNDTSCTSYTWNGNTYSSSGTYTHVTTISTGCDSISVLNLIITPPYTNTDSVIICKGDSVLIANNIYYSPGTYIDTFTAANGCDSILTTVIQMYAQPSSGSIQGPITVLQNSPVSYLPLPTNATSLYIWESLNSIYTSPSGDTITYNFPTPGLQLIYFIETTSDGCLGDTVWLQIIVESHSSITQTQIDALNIYPNPSRDIFNIEFSSLISQDLQIRIINSVGDVVFIEDIQSYIGEYKRQISLEEYSKAIYFLEIQTDDGIVNKKLILQ